VELNYLILHNDVELFKISRANLGYIL